MRRGIPRVRPHCNSVDTHELLKQELQKQGTDGDSGSNYTKAPTALPNVSSQVMQPTPQIPTPAQNKYGFEDIELYFDSVVQTMSPNLGELQWSIPVLNNSQDIKNCIRVHVPRFYFPKVHPANPSDPEFFYYRRVFMEIVNTPSNQAVLGPNGNRFHFEFAVNDITGQAVELVPIKDTFFFQRPVNSFSEIIVKFMVPDHGSVGSWKLVPIQNNRVHIKTLAPGGVGSNPIRFRIITPGVTTSIIGPVGPLTPGVVVFINDLATNSGNVNTAVNNPAGIFITTVVNSTDFEIGSIDGTPINDEYVASMYIPKNRVAFPMVFTSLTNYETNGADVINVL